MSTVTDVATVQLLMADFAAIDGVGKLNIIGGGITVVGHVPGSALTNPIALVVSVSVPPAYYGQSSALVITLERASGDVVSVPIPDSSAMQPMRFEQTARFDNPKLAEQVRPRDYLRGRFQLVVAFRAGLPLSSGEGYVWRVQLDEETRDEWTEQFIVSEHPPESPTPGLN